MDGSESGNTLVLIELILVLALVFGFGLRELRGLRRDRAAAPASRASSAASSSGGSSTGASSSAASSRTGGRDGTAGREANPPAARRVGVRR